jgi:FixJ family two-component response regulator
VIAIVDDDDCVRYATANLVRSLGLKTAEFGCAEDFLRSHDVDRTTCLVLDIQLPGLNGIELQRRLRADGHTTPVIFITGVPDERLRDRAFAGGAVGFLRKPFDSNTLIFCIDKILNRTAA